jgi:hypothetical protein
VSDWQIVEPSVASALSRFDRPLEALAAAEIPAFVIRQAWTTESCQRMVDRLIAEDLLFDPYQPVPEKFIEQSIPEGYYREGKNTVPNYAWNSKLQTGRIRIDVGTSLGYRGSEGDAFFQHARQSNETLARVFSDENPLELLYRKLEELSVDKTVRTAAEPDGREYGAGIIRAHYGGYTYRPHFDSVRLREKRDDFAVSKFRHQFAGVLVLQNTTVKERSAHGILHRCVWEPSIDPHLFHGTFHEYAAEAGIENVEVELEAGDLYFFNTRCIHEVPGIDGELPRIVLATFIGFDEAEQEIFVWS